jgi:chromosome segregation ATPase
LSVSSKELENLRLAHVKLEESSQTASLRNGELETELRAAQMQLTIAESESLEAANKLIGADKELVSLRESNAKLDSSEKELLARLTSAEEELDTAREKNAQLEAFLERVEADMADAHSAVEDTERRYHELMEESQSKLEAAKSSKQKYKRRLDERNNELEILINENSDLHHQVGDQTRQLGALKKGKEKLVEELSKKEKYIGELGSSSDNRIRSLNSAYDGLRKKFEEQQQQHRQLDGKHDKAVRLEAELERKMTEIEEMRHHQDEYAASYNALEKEVQSLRDDKRAFEKLVATLQEKIRHLDVLEEWEEPNELNRTTSPRHITIQDGPYDTAPSSPISSHARSSIGHVSVQFERPQTSASTVSHEEDLDSWAMQVEKIRMQRNDAAVQLKGMKKSRHNLKKTLRDTDAQLHRLEKETKT